jgi:hypothetical protein
MCSPGNDPAEAEPLDPLEEAPPEITPVREPKDRKRHGPRRWTAQTTAAMVNAAANVGRFVDELFKNS